MVREYWGGNWSRWREYNLGMDVTPILRQYKEIKARYPNELLLFRMGDFYELFFEDAEIASRVLGIALTSKPMSKKYRVPMAGVPVKAADGYISRLIRAGHSVAICEQIGEPTPGRGPMRREVVEVITPGTVLEPSLLDDKEFNYIASVNPSDKVYGVAIVELTTGDFSVFESTPQRTIIELEKRKIAEILLPEGTEFGINSESVMTYLPDWHFDTTIGERRLKEFFGITTLAPFEIEDLPMAIGAANALLDYLRGKKPGMIDHLKRILRLRLEDRMYLDKATIKNLEIVEPIEPDGSSLLCVLDQTLTPMGGRLLREVLIAPLINSKLITERLFYVESLIKDPTILKDIRNHLARIKDIERITSRVSAGKSNPREVVRLADSLLAYEDLRKTLLKHMVISNLLLKCPTLEFLANKIKSILVEDPPATMKEGMYISEDADPELKKLRELAKNGKRHLLELEIRERNRTGIPNLRVGFNNVFGYYIEVTKSHLDKVPDDYIRKQTLTNSERFITPELKDLESKILAAEELAKKLEREIWEGLRREIVSKSVELKEVSNTIGYIDYLQSLASVAKERRYVKPIIRDDGVITITEGRHPVVELTIEGGFVPNDTKMNLTTDRVYIITGPNMSGKSTYLRQVALIVVMAQVGSFVPASHAEIGIEDRIFTRIGASDNLAMGVSTFLAEMIETAQILQNATTKSLIILDEVGRGTSTYDGFAIAWAVVEYILKKIGAKTLFATHYHQLSELGKRFPGIKNYTMKVKEWEDKVVFLRKVVPGETDRSYGVHVAKLAGIPEDVIIRAKEVQEDIERDGTIRTRLMQLSLFEPSEDRTKVLLETIKKIDPDRMSPKDALNFLYRLKKEIQKS